MAGLGPIVCSACLACTDFSNYAADISVGRLGYSESYTTTLVWNRVAQRLINQAINQGYLEEIDQKGALEKIGRMAKRKSIRGGQVLAERKAKRIS